MANIVGYPYDSLAANVVFHYVLRANFADSGPNSLANAVANGSGVSTPAFKWPDLGLGGYYGASGGGLDYLALPEGAVPSVGSAEWTLDFWVYGTDWDRLSSVSVGIFYVDAESGAGSANTLSIKTSTASDQLTVLLIDSGGASFNGVSINGMVNNTAHFISLCRKGDVVYFYVDGALNDTIDVSAATGFNFADTPSGATGIVSALEDSDATFSLVGYIADLRWTSVARYDGSNFQVPANSAVSGSPNPLDPADTLKVRAFGITLDGHDFYVLRCGQQGTFVYDMETQQWSEWETAGYSSSWNATFGLNWNDKVVVADQSSPILWAFDMDGFYDQDTLDLTRVVTGVFKISGRDYVPCNSLQLTAAVGNPNPGSAANPTVSLSFSDDWGATYSTPDAISLAAGAYSQQLWWSSLGAMGDPGRVFLITDVGGTIRIDDAQLEIG